MVRDFYFRERASALQNSPRNVFTIISPPIGLYLFKCTKNTFT